MYGIQFVRDMLCSAARLASANHSVIQDKDACKKETKKCVCVYEGDRERKIVTEILEMNLFFLFNKCQLISLQFRKYR